MAKKGKEYKTVLEASGAPEVKTKAAPKKAASTKQAAHKLDSADDFPTLGGK